VRDVGGSGVPADGRPALHLPDPRRRVDHVHRAAVVGDAPGDHPRRRDPPGQAPRSRVSALAGVSVVLVGARVRVRRVELARPDRPALVARRARLVAGPGDLRRLDLRRLGVAVARRDPAPGTGAQHGAGDCRYNGVMATTRGGSAQPVSRRTFISGAAAGAALATLAPLAASAEAAGRKQHRHARAKPAPIVTPPLIWRWHEMVADGGPRLTGSAAQGSYIEFLARQLERRRFTVMRDHLTFNRWT